MSSACLEQDGSSSMCNCGVVGSHAEIVVGSHAEIKINSFYKIFNYETKLYYITLN